MFQPQPTPYSPVASYGVGNFLDFPGFQPPQPSTGPSVVHPRSGGPTVFQDPVFAPVNITAGASASALGFNYNTPQFKMAASDLEEQEALARNFQPDLQGPLVGEKKSSHAITEEYAKADPIYVAKTAALPQTYSHYRPILGDGNCGWRAAGFSYFETLVRLGSKTQLEGEIARMMSLDSLLATAGGFEMELLEFMVEETTTLLSDLAASIHDPQEAERVLMDRWNNASSSAGIMYHLRMLASSWLKGHPDNYLGFIPGENGVEGYCKGTLEVVSTEIDHLGMSLLIDVLLKPIGFAVEIVYLDRSRGSQVNSHMFQAEEPNGAPTYPNGPIIHLLYRPSHYDILYQDRSPSISLPISRSTQVNRATSFSQQHTIQSTPSLGFSSDMSALLCIPGFAPAPSHHFPPYSPVDYTASPISASLSPVSAGPSSTTTNLTLLTDFTQPLSSPLNTSPFPTTLPMHPIRPLLSAHPSDITSPLSAASSFRPSKYELEAKQAATDWQEPVAFQTATFKNSHYNKAHYNNPDFQPEEWNPDWEELGMGAGRKRSH